MNIDHLAALIETELKKQGSNPYKAAKDAGLPGNSIRYIINRKEPSFKRACEVLSSLGITLKIGADAGQVEYKRKKAQTNVKTFEDHTQGLVRAVHESGGDPIPADLRGVLLENKADLSDTGLPVAARPVDIVELDCAAGGGAEVLTETVAGCLWFRRDWLDEHALDPKECVVMGVHGESMQTTLMNGAKILVNRAHAARVRRTDKIYVIRTDDGLLVKRLDKTGPGWQLVSDNRKWPAIPLPTDAEIIGQVVWTAHTLSRIST